MWVKGTLNGCASLEHKGAQVHGAGQGHIRGVCWLGAQRGAGRMACGLGTGSILFCENLEL